MARKNQVEPAGVVRSGAEKGRIGLLRQIQHMVLIRDEAASVGAREQAEALTAELARLVERLDPETASLYRRLSLKSRIFMAPLSKGNCSACGLKVPMSVLQHVIAGDRMTACGSCGRILYAPEVRATGVRTGEPDPKFLLSRFSTAKLMVPRLKATTPSEAMAELVAVLAKEGAVSDADAVVRAALERERILTTAVGNGLAFPHMRGVEEGVLTFACGLAPAGIDWNGERVHLVFFTAFPVIASPFYLKLIAAIARTFEDGEKLPFVLAAADAKTLWKELNKATRVAVKNIRM
ncbi:MAG: PTS sugar transporter subunit IIA [Kiritimatiellia bacterium]